MSDTELSTRAEHGGKPVDGMHYVKKKKTKQNSLQYIALIIITLTKLYAHGRGL